MWRRWNARAHHPGCYEDGNHPVVVNHQAVVPVFPRRVVSYSLFWSTTGGAAGYRGRAYRLGEYMYGLWCAIQAAQDAGWGVHVYHNGSVERVLSKFRSTVPPNVIRFIRVDVAPDLKNRRYLGCLFRLLAADDPNVDVFLSRDLDDTLDPDGLRMMVDKARWPSTSCAHFQAEQYDTPLRTHMANMGWFGQRNGVGCGGGRRPSMAAAILRYARGSGDTDFYTSDEVFLTDVWLPKLPKPVSRLASHGFRRALLPPSRRPTAYRAFLYGRRPTVDLSDRDAVVKLA